MDYLVLNLEKTKSKYSFVKNLFSPFDIGIPLFESSDKTIEEIYYFRWHTFCKHIKETENGYVITEFFPLVPWAGKYNTISCPAGHHIYEGRWLYDKKYLDSYCRFWFSHEGEPRRYSFWAADAIFAAAKISGDFSVAKELYESLKQNFFKWQQEKELPNGMYCQIDDRDGMEYSIGGSGIRPTINSYMYGDAIALLKIAKLLGESADEKFFREKAEQLKKDINTKLWDESAQFYKTASAENEKLVDVRELVGYVPWYFNIPDEEKSVAWKFLNDENFFAAPFGPTTAERNHRDFMKEFDHECLWNGPSWPFATSQTLTALGNLLCNYDKSNMRKSDYFNLLKQFASCHYIEEDGVKRPFIDENLDPFTGRWLARSILRKWFESGFQRERGEDYNHSTFCDLVLSGLVGIRCRDDDVLVINPLFEEENLDYMCADGVLYHGNRICVLFDKSGKKYNMGKGFSVYLNGEKVFESPKICRFEFDLGGK